MKRNIIKIDEDKYTGCGQCSSGCPGDALQFIDDKARLVNDLFCDGLGASWKSQLLEIHFFKEISNSIDSDR